jgi:hypothetical protein
VYSIDNSLTPVASARKAMEFVRDLEPSSFGRRSELGDLNFDESIKHVQAVKEILATIDEARLDFLPSEVLTAISQNIAQLSSFLQNIAAFSLTQPGHGVSERDSYQAQIVGVKESLVRTLVPYSGYFIASRSSDAELRDQLGLELKQFQQSAEGARKEIEQQLEDAKRVVEGIRSQSAELGIGNEAKNFSDVAKVHKDKAIIWFWLTTSVLALSVFVAFAALEWTSKNLVAASSFEIANFISTKLIIVGICFYAINLSGRNFMSHKHNEEVNRHRMKALQTYKSFVEGTSDATVRDAVLAHAANAVFAPQDTGFIKGQELAQTNQVLDLASRAAMSAPRV